MGVVTVLDALKGINAYPVPLRTLQQVATRRGLAPDAEMTPEMFSGKAYELATADVLIWLSEAPDVSQGGQSYSFTDEQRARLRRRASGIYGEYGEAEAAGLGSTYGYKGSRL